MAAAEPESQAVEICNSNFPFDDPRARRPAVIETGGWFVMVGGWLDSTGVAEAQAQGEVLYSQRVVRHMRWVYAFMELDYDDDDDDGTGRPAVDHAGRPRISLLVAPWRVGDTWGLGHDVFPPADEPRDWRVLTDWNRVAWGFRGDVGDHGIEVGDMWMEVATRFVIDRAIAGEVVVPWLKLVDYPVPTGLGDPRLPGLARLEALYRDD